MGAHSAGATNGRGRPKRRLWTDELLAGYEARPASTDGWFTVGDRLAALSRAGYAVEDMALSLGVSPAFISRMIKGSKWPKAVRARILLCREKFPPEVLMRMARQTFKDQGSQTAKDGRIGPKSRLTLLGAVLLTIEGKPLPKLRSASQSRAEHFEKMAIEERGRRQALQSRVDELEGEKKALFDQLSTDVLSQKLKENQELLSEVQRLRLVPGAPQKRPEKSADLQRQDDDLGSVLKCRVDTLDWPRGIMLIKAGNGDMLDGIRERILMKLGRG